jgi:hypothetical protein
MIKINLLIITIKKIFFFVVICLFFNISTAIAQKIHTKKLLDARFTEHYRVLESDTAIRDGKYELYYKSHLIEKGQYKNGERSGIWFFYNLNNLFEFQYDFTRDSVLKNAASKLYEINNYQPPIFLGSPLIPYIHILKAIGYPSEAYNNNIEGRVILSLIISVNGEILDGFISESLNDLMDEVVISTVAGFPDTWKWLPAKKNGVKIESLYNITVYFDLH